MRGLLETFATGVVVFVSYVFFAVLLSQPVERPSTTVRRPVHIHRNKGD